jgi:hypothetical protein
VAADGWGLLLLLLLLLPDLERRKAAQGVLCSMLLERCRRAGAPGVALPCTNLLLQQALQGRAGCLPLAALPLPSSRR